MNNFPSRVPCWCVTPNEGGFIHRFFDTSPISPSGRYLALFRFPFEDRLPEPGEKGAVYLVDLQTGELKLLAETAGWETQMGANINWGGDDETLFFNDVDTQTWQPFAWKMNPLTGAKNRMDGTVYHASPDGRFLISANMTTMRRTQPGYGVMIPLDRMRRNVGPVEDDGFYLTDTSTGKRRLLLSIKDAIERTRPALQLSEEEAACSEIYGFHSKFNPQGDRLMLSLRWFPDNGQPRWDLFSHPTDRVRFAWVTIKPDGSDIHCIVGPEEWDKGGHHATWFPDGKRISMNLAVDGDGVLRFMQVNADGSSYKRMSNLVGSGHPSVHPNNRHLITDAYLGERFGNPADGTVPLRWIDLTTDTETELLRVPIAPTGPIGALRCDPHPAWDRSHRYITFNGVVDRQRRVFIADLAGLL